jgi:hypothetical protein
MAGAPAPKDLRPRDLATCGGSNLVPGRVLCMSNQPLQTAFEDCQFVPHRIQNRGGIFERLTALPPQAEHHRLLLEDPLFLCRCSMSCDLKLSVWHGFQYGLLAVDSSLKPYGAVQIATVAERGRFGTEAASSPDICSYWPDLTQCMVRPCVARGFVELSVAVLHQCIRPLIGAVGLRAIMDIKRACDLITG